MNIYRIEGKEYVAESPEAAYQQHMKGWRHARFKGGFSPIVPVLVSTEDRKMEVVTSGSQETFDFNVRTAGLGDAPKKEPAFWDCDLTGERLIHTSMNEAVRAELESLAVASWTEMLFVYSWQRVVITENRIQRISDHILESLLSVLDSDEELGDPEEPTEPDDAMKSAALEFVRKVSASYRVWACERSKDGVITVCVPEWVRANAPEWLSDAAVVETMERLEKKT